MSSNIPQIKFHIISIMYNAVDAIVQHIEMLKQQSHTHFQCVIVDDISSDQSVAVARDAIDGDKRFQLIENTEKKYKVRNVIDAINAASPASEDVVVIVDGDDRLADKNVLGTLNDIYGQKSPLLTYGSFADENGKISDICQAYSASVVRKNAFRKAKWHASHLKSFKYKVFEKIKITDFQISEKEFQNTINKALYSGKFKSWLKWKKIQREELLDPSGEYIRRMDDKVLFYPMLEMAGDKSLFVDKILYVYSGQYVQNKKNNKRVKLIPGDHKNKWYGRLIRQILINKKPYKKLMDDF